MLLELLSVGQLLDQHQNRAVFGQFHIVLPRILSTLPRKSTETSTTTLYRQLRVSVCLLASPRLQHTRLRTTLSGTCLVESSIQVRQSKL